MFLQFFAENNAEETETAQTENEVCAASPCEIDRLKKLAESLAITEADKRVKEEFSAEEKSLKEIYPGFSLDEELVSNNEFARFVKMGMPVRNAFEAANFNTILEGAMHYAAKKAVENSAKATRRVSENPVSQVASASVKTDINSLTEREIRKIIGQVQAGAKITFR